MTEGLSIFALTMIVMFLLGGIDNFAEKHGWKTLESVCDLWLFVFVFALPIAQPIGNAFFIGHERTAWTTGLIIIVVSGWIANVTGHFVAHQMMERSET